MLSADHIILHQYENLSSFTEPADRGVHVGELGDIISSHEASPAEGCRMAESVASIIMTGNNYVVDYSTVLGKTVYDGKIQGGTPKGGVLHFPTTITEQDRPAFKTLYSLVEKDGLLYMQFNYAEMKYDGTAVAGFKYGHQFAGDAHLPPYGRLEIGDKDLIAPDENNKIARFGTHHTMFPIGIANKNRGGE